MNTNRPQGPRRGPPTFLDELKRRKVVRVALVYLAAAFAALEASEIIVERLGLPDWTVTALLVAAIAGFPLTVVLAWVFDLTAEGIQKTESVEEGGAPVVGSWMTPGSLAAIGGAVLLAIGAGWLASRTAATAAERQAPAAGVSRSSIAVLPFDNLSGREEDTYFSDGLAEELLNLLARVEGLKVAARTSSFGFRGWDGDIRIVGDSLGVATVLEGSVRRSGDVVRVTAQLIDAEDGFHLWSETYDEEPTDAFAVQDRIAAEIAEALSVRLAPEDSATARPASEEVGDLYLLGRARFAQREPGPLQEAVEFFERAVEQDPKYAPAHAGLALAWAVLPAYAPVPAAEAAANVRASADRAIALDDRLSEPYQALCQSLAFLEWRWAEAEAACDAALERAPNSANAHQWRAELLLATGRPAEAAKALAEATALDPLSAVVWAAAANAEIVRGDLRTARAYIDKARDFDPALSVAQTVDLVTRLQLGDVAGAARIGAEMGLPPGLVPAVSAADRGTDALAAARIEVRRLYSRDAPEGALVGAILHSLSGDEEATLGALELAFENRNANLALVYGFPGFDLVRDDPRFQAILNGMGL